MPQCSGQRATHDPRLAGLRLNAAEAGQGALRLVTRLVTGAAQRNRTARHLPDPCTVPDLQEQHQRSRSSTAIVKLVPTLTPRGPAAKAVHDHAWVVCGPSQRDLIVPKDHPSSRGTHLSLRDKRHLRGGAGPSCKRNWSVLACRRQGVRGCRKASLPPHLRGLVAGGVALWSQDHPRAPSAAVRVASVPQRSLQ